MNSNDIGWVVVMGLLYLSVRRPMVLAVPVSIIVAWDFGTAGLAILWSVLLTATVLGKETSA